MIIYTRSGEALNIMFEGEIYAVTTDNQQFDEILRLVREQDESFVELLANEKAVQTKLQNLTPRLAIRGDDLLYDGVVIEDAYSDLLIEFYHSGEKDWEPLAKFYENLMVNLTQDTREQLARWVKASRLTINEDGMIVAYKGVHQADNGKYRSSGSGHAFVDGEEVNGQVEQSIGSVVTMPRNEVTHDPNRTCAAGLHFGTYKYASSFAPVVLRVVVDPRDVVSVPTDYNGAKGRCCRYTVDSVANSRVDSPLYRNETLVLAGPWNEEDDDEEDEEEFPW